MPTLVVSHDEPHDGRSAATAIELLDAPEDDAPYYTCRSQDWRKIMDGPLVDDLTLGPAISSLGGVSHSEPGLMIDEPFDAKIPVSSWGVQEDVYQSYWAKGLFRRRDGTRFYRPLLCTMWAYFLNTSFEKKTLN